MAMRFRTPEAVEAAKVKYTQRHYTLGLDLGQAQDPTAVAIVERVRVPKIVISVPVEDPPVYEDPTYSLVHLERLPLGVPYPSVIDHVQVMLSTAPLRGNCKLVIDQTGVGRPIFDLFRKAKLFPNGVTITAGDGWHRDPDHGDSYRVSKLVLVSRLEAALHAGVLRISKDLRELPVLLSELQDFTSNRTASGYVKFGARSGRHDDLVLALAIALWHSSHMDGQYVGVGRVFW
jgi:hypothetical protein